MLMATGLDLVPRLWSRKEQNPLVSESSKRVFSSANRVSKYPFRFWAVSFLKKSTT